MMKFNRSLRRIDVNARLFPRLRRFLSREACCIFVVKLLSYQESKRIDDFELKFEIRFARSKPIFLSFFQFD